MLDGALSVVYEGRPVLVLGWLWTRLWDVISGIEEV
jgi:hypothetical protein